MTTEQAVGAGPISRSDDERAVRAMLAAWASTDPWLRREIAVDEAVGDVMAVGPTQLVVRTRFEERGVRLVRRSRPRDGQERAAPDPWSVEIALPKDAAEGHEVTRKLPDEIPMLCTACDGRGQSVCYRCGGTGTVEIGTHTSSMCATCNGDGDARCTTCAGSGAVWAALTVWARIGVREDARLVEDAAAQSLPNEVFLDLQNPNNGGRVFHAQRAERLTGLHLDGGYRTSANAGPLAESTRALLESIALPTHAQTREQVLELRKVPAFSLKVGRGSVIVYGDPPVVFPRDALRRRSRSLPIAVAAAVVGIGSLVGWLLLR